jgi:hypothetical protein
VVGHILANELRSWDGSLRDERGRRVVRLIIRLDERSRELGFAAAVPRGLSVTEIEAGGTRIGLGEGPQNVLTGLTIAKIPLESDWVVTTDRVKLRYDSRPVVPFRPNDDVGGWTSVQQGELWETHYVLVHDSQLDAVRKFFEGYLSQPPLTRILEEPSLTWHRQLRKRQSLCSQASGLPPRSKVGVISLYTNGR